MFLFITGALFLRLPASPFLLLPDRQLWRVVSAWSARIKLQRIVAALMARKLGGVD
jgi:hypothetical protein